MLLAKLLKNDLNTRGGEEKATAQKDSFPDNHSNEDTNTAQTLASEWNLAAESLGIQLWRQETGDDPELIRTVAGLLSAGDPLERLLNRARGALNRGKYGAKGGRTLVDVSRFARSLKNPSESERATGREPAIQSSRLA